MTQLEEIGAVFNTIGGYIGATVEFFKNFKENVANISADVMTWTFETLTKVVLHTPSFLFDSEWLKQNTITFTGLALVMTICIAMLEGFQHLLSGVKETKSLTSMSRVYQRLPLVIAVSAAAPTLFYYGFTGLNWVTEKIIGFANYQMQQGLANVDSVAISALELTMFVAFDIALIGMMIPVFLQNFRRWFELLVLATITPLALSCWMFESKEYLFHMWWENVKKRSTVQLIYAVYLLLIGSLMFGTKIPETGWDFIIKLGVMIGGLFSMANPPQIVRSHLNYHGSTGEVFAGANQAATLPEGVTEGTNKGYRFLKLQYLRRKRKMRDAKKK